MTFQKLILLGGGDGPQNIFKRRDIFVNISLKERMVCIFLSESFSLESKMLTKLTAAILKQYNGLLSLFLHLIILHMKLFLLIF